MQSDANPQSGEFKKLIDLYKHKLRTKDDEIFSLKKDNENLRDDNHQK